jgi:transcriptional regulator with XRE-family HTH domain
LSTLKGLFFALLAFLLYCIHTKGGEHMSIGNKEVLARNLKNYIIKSGKERMEICESLDIPYSTLTDWLNAKKYPRINSIEKLADYFNVSKSDLIEDFEEIKKDNDRLVAIIVKLRTSKDLVNVVEKLSSLDKTKLEQLSRFLDTII